MAKTKCPAFGWGGQTEVHNWTPWRPWSAKANVKWCVVCGTRATQPYSAAAFAKTYANFPWVGEQIAVFETLIPEVPAEVISFPVPEQIAAVAA